MLNVAQKKLTAAKKLANAETKQDMHNKMELLKELREEINAEISRLQEFASAYGHGGYHTKTRRQAPNVEAFKAIAIKHGFDADEHIKTSEYTVFGWNA
jgi:homoserine acetyltransferase